MAVSSSTIGNVKESIKQEIHSLADYLPRIAEENPQVFERRLKRKLDDINALSQACLKDRSDLIEFSAKVCTKELKQSLIHARNAFRPLGYAGDYQIIEWIYDYMTDSPKRGRLWDEYLHRQAGSQAVRNRKDFFCEVFSSVCEQRPAPRYVLDIACGPCRELIEAVKYAGASGLGTHFHCVDIEESAIAYSKKRVRDIKGVSFQWETANALRIRPAHRYDLVWAAGLFDYLNDRLAKLLLKRMWHWTKAGGTCVVGNFHPRNPSRNYMEWLGNWCLVHRTEEDMRRLCRDAGIPSQKVEITHEPLGVIVFALSVK